MKIAIIGSGFCGLALAWYASTQFSKSPTICIFDTQKIGGGTSGIAAGLFHPFSGAHAKLNRIGFEGVAATQQLLQVASQALGKSVKAPQKGILRVALTLKQQQDFQLCAERYPHEVEWLEPAACQDLVPGCAWAPGLWVKQGESVYSSLYLEGLWQACTQQGVQFEQRRIQTLAELDAFDLVLLAGGAESHLFPETQHLKLSCVKGQVLEYAWPRHLPPLAYPLNSHVYLLMTEKKLTCLIGATFEKNCLSRDPEPLMAQAELWPQALQLFPPLVDASFVACHAGMRAVSAQHLPLIQRLSSKQWILTGMGSKGLLYHALYAQQLITKIKEERGI